MSITFFNKNLIVVILTLFTFLLSSSTFTLWPEMVVYPYLFNNGFRLYTDIINPYPPLFSLFLAVFSQTFNYSVLSYKLLTWLVAVSLGLTVFYVSRKLFSNGFLSTIALLFFCLTSISFGVNGLWFELIQAPIVIISLYKFHLYLKTKKTKHLDWSLVFLAFALLIKQQVAWLALFYVVIILISEKKFFFQTLLRLRRVFIFLAPVTIIHVVFLIKTDTFGDFYYWAIYFPILKASSAPGYFLAPNIKQISVVLSLLILFLPIFIQQKKLRTLFIFSLPLLLFAYPRFDYFHLIPLVSFLSLFFGENVKLYAKSSLAIKVIVLLAAIALVFHSARFYINNWQKSTRFFEPEILQAAESVSLAVGKESKVFIQNGPDQLLPLARVLPPKPWAIQFPWYLENTDLEQRIVNSLEKTEISYVVSKPYTDGSRYELAAYEPKLLSSHINSNYENFYKISDTLWLKVKKGCFN